jgi:hypothetical protein
LLFRETVLDLDDIETSPIKTDDVRLRCQRFIVAVVPRVPVAIFPSHIGTLDDRFGLTQISLTQCHELAGTCALLPSLGVLKVSR